MNQTQKTVLIAAILISIGVAHVFPDHSTPIQLQPLPNRKVLHTDYHVYQTFNNCGPAALSMALRYYDITISQETLGNQLRPYQHPEGDNDDKSVTLAELADKAKEYNLVPFHRPNGTIEMMQHFISHGIPVITRTWLKADEDIGHYRVVTGYDKTEQYIIQEDSMQGKDLQYSYSKFNTIWEKFNYEYLVMVPNEKVNIAKAILGKNTNNQKAWETAAERARSRLTESPDNITARFNLVVALHNTGKHKQAVTEFEKIQQNLPPRALWYQTEPIKSYVLLKQYDTALSIIESILKNDNRAFSELYMIRGNIYLNEGKTDLARKEYKKAHRYNKNMKAPLNALEKIHEIEERNILHYRK